MENTQRTEPCENDERSSCKQNNKSNNDINELTKDLKYLNLSQERKSKSLINLTKAIEKLNLHNNKIYEKEEGGVVIKGGRDATGLHSKNSISPSCSSHRYGSEDESDSTDEGIVIRGDDDGEISLLHRGVPGIPVEDDDLEDDELKRELAGYIALAEEQSKVGGKRGHNYLKEPYRKGWKPNTEQLSFENIIKADSDLFSTVNTNFFNVQTPTFMNPNYKGGAASECLPVNDSYGNRYTVKKPYTGTSLNGVNKVQCSNVISAANTCPQNLNVSTTASTFPNQTCTAGTETEYLPDILTDLLDLEDESKKPDLNLATLTQHKQIQDDDINLMNLVEQVGFLVNQNPAQQCLNVQKQAGVGYQQPSSNQTDYKSCFEKQPKATRKTKNSHLSEKRGNKPATVKELLEQKEQMRAMENLSKIREIQNQQPSGWEASPESGYGTSSPPYSPTKSEESFLLNDHFNVSKESEANPILPQYTPISQDNLPTILSEGQINTTQERDLTPPQSLHLTTEVTQSLSNQPNIHTYTNAQQPQSSIHTKYNTQSYNNMHPSYSQSNGHHLTSPQLPPQLTFQSQPNISLQPTVHNQLNEKQHTVNPVRGMVYSNTNLQTPSTVPQSNVPLQSNIFSQPNICTQPSTVNTQPTLIPQSVPPSQLCLPLKDDFKGQLRSYSQSNDYSQLKVHPQSHVPSQQNMHNQINAQPQQVLYINQGAQHLQNQQHPINPTQDVIGQQSVHSNSNQQQALTVQQVINVQQAVNSQQQGNLQQGLPGTYFQQGINPQTIVYALQNFKTEQPNNFSQVINPQLSGHPQQAIGLQNIQLQIVPGPVKQQDAKKKMGRPPKQKNSNQRLTPHHLKPVPILPKPPSPQTSTCMGIKPPPVTSQSNTKITYSMNQGPQVIQNVNMQTETHARIRQNRPDILSDHSMVTRAARDIAGKTLEEILRIDEDGDTLLNQYIVAKDPRAVYMVHAYLNRLQREHNEGKLNIRQPINIANKAQQTSVYLATYLNQPVVLEWLLKVGADPNQLAIANTQLEQKRRGALHYAASRGDEYYDALSVLADSKNIKLDLKNSDGLTALHLAIQAHGKHHPKGLGIINSQQIIQALIYKGADMNCGDGKSGKTPFHYLVETKDFNLMRNVFKIIPPANLKEYAREKTYAGNTALHIASQLELSNIDIHKQIIQLLMNSGADPSIKNVENQTAAHVSYKLHRTELNALLRSSNKHV